MPKSEYKHPTPKGELRTAADAVAQANDWPLAMGCGYLDGKRDKERNIKPPIPRTEMTDYAHGYWKGYSGK